MTSSALDDYLLPRHNQAGALLLSDSVQLLEYNTTYTNWLPIAMNLVNNAALRAYVVQRVPAHAFAAWVHAPLTRNIPWRQVPCEPWHWRQHQRCSCCV